jgi:hypothetical protein
VADGKKGDSLISHGEVARWRLMRIALLVVTVAVSGWGCAKASDAQPDAKRKFVPAGWTVEQELQGDLDGDGIPDAVLMLVEEGHSGPTDEAGRSLIVLAGQRDGSFAEMATNRKLLLCVQCFGAIGGKPRLSIQRNVLIVEQETGSRETTSGLWRLRFDPASKRIRLIGLDVKKADRGTGVSTSESTNYSNGKRITESLRYDEAKKKDVVVGKKTSSVATTPIFLEDVDAGPLQSDD